MFRAIILALLLNSCAFIYINNNSCFALRSSEIGQKPTNNQIIDANQKYCKFCSDYDERYIENCKQYNNFWGNL